MLENGIHWRTFRDTRHSLKRVHMKIRPADYRSQGDAHARFPVHRKQEWTALFSEHHGEQHRLQRQRHRQRQQKHTARCGKLSGVVPLERGEVLYLGQTRPRHTRINMLVQDLEQRQYDRTGCCLGGGQRWVLRRFVKNSSMISLTYPTSFQRCALKFRQQSLLTTINIMMSKLENYLNLGLNLNFATDLIQSRSDFRVGGQRLWLSEPCWVRSQLLDGQI